MSAAETRVYGKRLLKEAMPPRWKLYLLSVVCMLGVAGFTSALAYSTRLIVNDVFVAEDTSAAYYVAALVVGVSLGKSFFGYVNSIISAMFNRSIVSSYQKLLFRKLLAKDVRQFAGKHAAMQMSQVKLFGEACGKTVVGATNKLFLDIMVLLGLLAVMLLQDPLMTLLSAVIFPLIFFIVSTLSNRVRGAAGAETELTGAYFAVGAEAFEGIKTVKSYGLEKKSISKFEEAVTALETRLLGIVKITSATVPLMELLGGIVIGVFVVYAAWQTITNGKTPGEFTAFITAFLMAYQPAERISKTWVELQKSLVHVGRMFELFDEPSDQRKDGTKTLHDVSPALAFNDVSFFYNQKSKALDGIDFRLEAGDWVAVVGQSGAGKSTLIDLVQRFYDPQEGCIEIGGTDLRDLHHQALRDNIALISQDVFLFDGTIAENIRDGNPEATDEEVQKAALNAQLGDFLETLPNGLDTAVGPNGKGLSGGQKQRVGIARALAKKAKIYIFDEATSALDGENERKILETLVREMADTTILFVTHRPSTLDYVNKVLLLEKGHMTALESPGVMRATNTHYRALFHNEDAPQDAQTSA
ncbi:ABC transporter ATP-binding protein [Algirhabdus cladophorae]|uniref:ABC transporter ATP-binding protein n=1 Tax=Algirhabdus cladophorae TaxID=3377108 RepID=UPI003B84629E